MKLIFRNVLGVSLALGLFSHSSIAGAETVIIVNPANTTDSISVDDVNRIYRGKKHRFADGTRAEPVDQSSGSEIRGEFYRDYLDMTEAQAKRYWSKLMFSGKGRPPVELNGDRAVRAAVAGNVSAIGYVDSTNVDESVKVLDIQP
jgi:ABC-type phosphate transport system substrate-binding protein